MYCKYGRDFYQERHLSTIKSAREIIRIICQYIEPKSIIDVGCGVGTFLSVFMDDYNISDIIGVDGEWVDENLLKIPKKYFIKHDLKKPLVMDREFDLVISLEVAEHLPAECAESFVQTLIKLGPVIMFSAAIPQQGGVGHYNEQWPEYWSDLFVKYNYVTIDCLRNKLWKNPNILYWYAQNSLLFVSRDYIESNALLRDEFLNTDLAMLSIVHPEKYLFNSDYKNLSLKKIIVTMPILIFNAIKRRVDNLIK